MKQECEIVRDLMPLVLDDVASDGSKHMVSAHVQTCAECAAYMNQLKADLPAGQKGAVDSHAAFDAAAQTLRKQKRRRTLRNILLGALIVCILGLANLYCFDWLMNETRPGFRRANTGFSCPSWRTADLSLRSTITKA